MLKYINGKFIENKTGEYKKFENWLLECKENSNQLKYVQENNLLPEEIYGSLEKAYKTMITYVKSDPRSTYCHNDFVPNNILDTEPLTVFDPSPIINHPYLDVARSIIQRMAGSADPKSNNQFLEGYFQKEDKPKDTKALHACVLFTAHKKFAYWNKTKREKAMENVRKYLIENKHLLE